MLLDWSFLVGAISDIYLNAALILHNYLFTTLTMKYLSPACPGAVAVEAGCGGTLAPLGPPQNTAGMTFIRLVVCKPIVCTTVQVS